MKLVFDQMYATHLRPCGKSFCAPSRTLPYYSQPPHTLGNFRSTPGAVHNSIIFSILYLECNIATSFHGLFNCMQLVVRWVEHMAPQKSIFTQEGFSSNLMVSSTTLQLDKSLWPSQILLVCRSGRGSATPETDQTQTLPSPNHTNG